MVVPQVPDQAVEAKFRNCPNNYTNLILDFVETIGLFFLIYIFSQKNVDEKPLCFTYYDSRNGSL